MDRGQVYAALIARRWAELQRLEKALAERDQLTAVARGAEKADPLLGEIRSHSWLLRALLDSAGRPDDGPPVADALDRLRADFEDSIDG